VAIFSQAMLGDKPTRVFGDGEQTRDFVYVEDAVEADICAISGGHGGAFNIGSGQRTSVNKIFRSLHRSLQRFTGYNLAAESARARTGNVYQIYLNACKANRELGWTPRVSLEDGLLRPTEYFRRSLIAN